jgi:hypothetical protein
MTRAEILERAIRAKCLECSGGVKAQAKACRVTDCPLWGLTNLQHERTPRAQLRAEGRQLRISIEMKIEG